MADELQPLRSIPDPVALLEGMFAHAPVAYQIYRPDGHSLLVNRAFLELFGSQPPPEYCVLDDDIADATGQLATLRRAFAGETVQTTPVWYDPRQLKSITITEGRRCAMTARGFPLRDHDGNIAYVVFVFEDVTAELEAQERAEKERDLLRAILDQSGDGIIVADAAGELAIFNRVAAEQHGADGRGLHAAAWVERVGLQTLDGEPLPWRQFALHQALSARRVVEGRWRIRRPNGDLRTLSGTAAPVTLPDGKGGGAILVVRDETQRLTLEAQVTLANAQLRAIVDNTPNAIYLKDLDGRHLWMSPGYERRSGRAPGSFIGKTSREMFPEAADAMEDNDRRVREGRSAIIAEETVLEPRGACTYLTCKFPVFDEQLEVIAIGGVSTDVTELKQAAERLRQSEERFTRYFQASPLPAVITAPDGLILDANAACERFAGTTRAELVGHNALQLPTRLSTADRLRLMAELERVHAVRDFEVTFETPDGGRRHVLLSCERLEVDGQTRVLSIMHDVTDHLRLQDELRQSQKMEAVGRLAGGVAHDFNNLLTALSGFNELLLAALPADDRRRGFAERVGEAAERAAALTQQLLAFSRKQPMAIEELDVSEVVRSSAEMLRRLIGEDCELVCELASALDVVRADRSQVEQVVVNLVVNARDAMPRGGRITLTTAHVRIDRADYVRFTVHDTGIGIDAQTQARLFEPFFTTKEPGRGTGLGLSTVYGIVKQAGGQVRVESEPGRGALFEVLLPCAPRAAPTATADKRATERLRGRGTILLVEDDDSVRDFVGFVLRQQGYDVLDAEHGAQALERAAAHAGPIDLVISDLVMPHMSGQEVAEALQRTRPALRVLHISGYPRDRVRSDAEFLAKPFSREQLLARVEQLLPARSEGTTTY